MSREDLQILKLRVVDAAGRYYYAHKNFERTEGEEEADKELQVAQAELLRAYGKFCMSIKRQKRDKP